ncbi:MAG: sigma-70 family RNA polymerase sigma factor [Planctomycetota bacterium]
MTIPEGRPDTTPTGRTPPAGGNDVADRLRGVLVRAILEVIETLPAAPGAHTTEGVDFAPTVKQHGESASLGSARSLATECPPVNDRPTQLTAILSSADFVDGNRMAEILPVVYEELRDLARQQMFRERQGHTLQPTALVHEAWIRLVDVNHQQVWQNRAHFFGAAALAMRRILVDHARGRGAAKRGGAARRIDLDDLGAADANDGAEILALDEALAQLEAKDKRKHDVVMLRHFAGLSVAETAEALAISKTTVKEEWAFARAWLLTRIDGNDD